MHIYKKQKQSIIKLNKQSINLAIPTYQILMISNNVEFLGIVVAILKMATSRNCSMSGINSGHHYLPTYQIFMISDNVIFKMAAKTRYKKWEVNIQHCPISSKLDMWVDNDVPN
jgi:hypothetical protein